jgi:hypothetical protein
VDQNSTTLTPIEAEAPSDEFFCALKAKRIRALIQRDLPTLEELHAPEYQLITPAGASCSGGAAIVCRTQAIGQVISPISDLEDFAFRPQRKNKSV